MGWQALKELLLHAVTSPRTRLSYEAGLNSFARWLRGEAWPDFHSTTVQRYRTWLEQSKLSPSSINVYLSAIRRVADEAAENGFIDREIASAIIGIPGVRQYGVRTGNWLTPEEASALLAVPDQSSLKGVRDRAILGLLIGCALQRAELTHLHVHHFVMRDARWVLMDIVGRGKRVRTVPVPAWAKVLVDDWMSAAAIAEGTVFRAVNKGGRVWGEHITDDVVWSITREYGARIRKPGLAPHDLRRTCAKLCHTAGGALEQIQLLLGHSSAQTTQKYLGTRQNLVHSVNDHLPIAISLNKPGYADQNKPLVKKKPARSQPSTMRLPAAVPERPFSGAAEGT
ncbi:MAG: tyrosine-type recombinase/integrase [Bryobacteraceae bacterium]